MMQQVSQQETSSRIRFAPDCYAIRKNGQPMPARFIRYQDEFAIVAAPNGKEYSFSRDALVSIEEVESQLRRDRIAFVASSYQFEELTSNPARVIRCSHPTKKASSYLLLETAGGWVCSCPANAKNLFGGCKHTSALMVSATAAIAEPTGAPASVYPVAAEDW